MIEDVTANEIRVAGLRGYLARPGDDGGRGMLLLPMVTGIGEDIRRFARDIAGHGMTALSWDPWHGPSSDDTPLEELSARLGTLDDDAALAEQDRLLGYLFDELGLRRVGVIGWCLGGRFALLLGARDERLAGVISYHPTIRHPLPPHHRLDAIAEAGRIRAPVMMLYPGADRMTSREVFGKLTAALYSRPAGPSMVHIYPGARHGFAHRHEEEVDATAQALAWPQALAFATTATAAHTRRS